MKFIIDGQTLDPLTLTKLADSPDINIELAEDAQQRMAHSRHLLDQLIDQGETIYGVNTNMGGMARWLLPDSMRHKVQHNLIHAVATNVGPLFEDTVVRAAMIARLNALARGNSAVSMTVVEQLRHMINARIIPCVPCLGSLGTSGDLGPLAAIAQVAVGSGRARVNGEVMSGQEALDRCGLQPVTLSYKDGLALINGTSFMCAVLSRAVSLASTLLQHYLSVSALTFGILRGKKMPLSPIVQTFKHHPGQQEIAHRLFPLIEKIEGVIDDEHLSQSLHREQLVEPVQGSQQVEDHYSLRCIPQILGPIWDTLQTSQIILQRELNSASDNPLIDIKNDKVYHCGHFHGQYLSMCADHLKLALSTLANLAERRVDRLLDQRKNEWLPPFLAKSDAGIRLGLMGAQFMSSSLTAELRALSAPVSNQTLPTTADFQDVVSLGLVASRQALEVVDKCAYVLGCELLLACQAADLLGYTKFPEPVTILYGQLRHIHPFLDADRDLTAELETAHALMLDHSLIHCAADGPPQPGMHLAQKTTEGLPA